MCECTEKTVTGIGQFGLIFAWRGVCVGTYVYVYVWERRGEATVENLKVARRREKRNAPAFPLGGHLLHIFQFGRLRACKEKVSE